MSVTVPDVDQASISRFALVGAACFALNLLVLWTATGVFGVHYLTSAAVSFMAVTYFSFVLNRFFTFRAGGGMGRQTARYYLVTAASLGLSLLLMYVLVDLAELNYLVANCLAAVLLLFANYAAHSCWTFARARRTN
jgi:putative flippase GtrA